MNEVNSTELLCLTVRQPWAWLIVHAGKDIENRNWSTRVRGRVLIHAAKNMTLGEYNDAWWWAHEKCGVEPPHQDTLLRGGIIGSVEIVDCVTWSASPWFMGRYGFVMRDPQPLPFHPCRGALGFWKHNDCTEARPSGRRLQCLVRSHLISSLSVQ